MNVYIKTEQPVDGSKMLDECPFCGKPAAVLFEDGEIVHGQNPDCIAYPKIVGWAYVRRSKNKANALLYLATKLIK